MIIYRLASCMLASGSDDGSFSIWDLRGIQVWLLLFSSLSMNVEPCDLAVATPLDVGGLCALW